MVCPVPDDDSPLGGIILIIIIFTIGLGIADDSENISTTNDYCDSIKYVENPQNEKKRVTNVTKRISLNIADDSEKNSTTNDRCISFERKKGEFPI